MLYLNSDTGGYIMFDIPYIEHDIHDVHDRRVKVTKELNDVYHSMVNRCHNPGNKSFKYYGAKGVTVCDEWLNDKQSFFRWSLKNGYKRGLSIDKDRKHVDGFKMYSPDTCIWMEASENYSRR